MAFVTQKLTAMRLDTYLAENHGFSRSRAKALIEEGNVIVDGKCIKKPSFALDDTLSHDIIVDQSSLPYVSRGGLKLEGALKAFNVNPSGKVCADIGASTGGFTDCLLKGCAVKVYAVDSGTDQLVPVLKNDPRVVSIEQFNARNLTSETFGEACDLAVADLSFISQTYVLSGIASVLADGGEYIGLIKPQFECGREAIGKGGIVKSSKDHLFAIKKVVASALEVGFTVLSIIKSPITGGDGNVEFLIHAVKNGDSVAECKISDAALSALVNTK